MFNILQFIFATTTLFWVSGIPIEVDGKTFKIAILFSNCFLTLSTEEFFDLQLYDIKQPDDLYLGQGHLVSYWHTGTQQHDCHFILLQFTL